MGVLGLLIAHNGLSMVRNQRDLPRINNSEIQDWFHVSPRAIEAVARRHPRSGVNGLMAIWYFLGDRIANKHVTIPDWMAWSRWELEHVAHLEIEVAEQPMKIDRRDADRLRAVAEKRTYQRGSRNRKRIRPLYLVTDPAATRYVVAEQADGALFVLPESTYAALRAPAAAEADARAVPARAAP
jgi:hypothetical protein